jgi:hypothetical protein
MQLLNERQASEQLGVTCGAFVVRETKLEASRPCPGVELRYARQGIEPAPERSRKTTWKEFHTNTWRTSGVSRSAAFVEPTLALSRFICSEIWMSKHFGTTIESTWKILIASMRFSRKSRASASPYQADW